MEDFLFKVINPIFIIFFSIILDETKFFTFLGAITIINILFFIFLKLKNDKEGDRQ